MGLLDKVKAQATAATAAAKDAAQKGQAKLDEVQSKKGADSLLRDLGAAFYATKTGRATPSTEVRVSASWPSRSAVASGPSRRSSAGSSMLRMP